MAYQGIIFVRSDSPLHLPKLIALDSATGRFTDTQITLYCAPSSCIKILADAQLRTPLQTRRLPLINLRQGVPHR